ncbi:MAG TPA: FtsX-like permease family protein, partial [Vicinamibacterales bacterium]|nr:FtsX-like permease family protein [Vicinamibacterales bacterium]
AFRAGLVAAQVVFALVVLTSAGLLIRSFARVAVLPLGFDARGLVTGEFRLPTASASWREDARAFVRRLDGELRQRAGGLPITIASEMPYSQTTSSRTWQFMPADGSAAKAAGADIRVVASNYFDMLDIPVVRGRGFASTDVAGSDPVAVVNESFAREIGQGRDVIGARLDAGTPAFPVVTIVGVVADTRNGALALVPRRAAYTVLDQWPTERIAVALRGAATPIAATAMRDAVGSVDPEIPVINIDSIDRKIAGRERRRHFYLAVLTVFAALAGTLAAVGIYGVVTNVTGQRHREMGVRLALGASPRGLARMVVAGGLRPVWLGLGLGILAAWWTGRALQANREFRSQLYQISAQDPATIGIVAALLTTVAVFACWIPARRASMTSVVEVLKID